MKHFLTLFIALTTSITCIPLASAQTINIPDANLAAVVRESLGLGLNRPITQQSMNRLTYLNVHHDYLRSIEDLAGLEHATNLTFLDLSNNQIRDITPLAKLTKLKELALWNNQIVDLHAITNLTNLTKLALWYNQVDDITPLANLTNLTTLELEGNQVSNLTPLANLTNLTELRLGENQIRDITPLAKLTNLTSLSLSSRVQHDVPIRNSLRDLTPLANLTNLTGLGLSGCDISDLTPLAKLTNLTGLGLRQNQIGDITPLANLTNLESVGLAYNQLRDITPLANLTNLEHLYLDSNQISDISVLTNLTNLTQLDLDFNQIGDITALANLTKVPELWMRGNQIVDITPLANLTNLTRLKLDDNQISDITALANLTNLTLLGLSQNQVRDITPLANLTNLKGLELPGNRIRDVTPLIGLVRLEWLYLNGNPILDPSPLNILLRRNPTVVIYLAGGVLNPLEEPTGAISVSELMFTSEGGVLPQWIELYNRSLASEVNLEGWQLEVESLGADGVHRHSTIHFNALTSFPFDTFPIFPNQTVLLVTSGARHSGIFPAGKVYDLSVEHEEAFDKWPARNSLLGTAGFSVKLLDTDRILVDIIGNLDGDEQTEDVPAWALPQGKTGSGVRTSLRRRYENHVPLSGIELTSWVRAADVPPEINSYYGHPTDVGNPGYRKGGPLPVVLSHFRSERTDTGVVIRWETASEVETAGFNLLRGTTWQGPFTQLNASLIPGAGTTGEQHDYTWTDTAAKPNVVYYYRIEEVLFDGKRQTLATTRLKGHVSAHGKLTTRWSALKSR